MEDLDAVEPLLLLPLAASSREVWVTPVIFAIFFSCSWVRSPTPRSAALISEAVKSCELVLYEDLGAEAVYKLYVEDLFAVVTYDVHGGDLFTEGIEKYKVK